jgi:hypothetical protein
MVRPGARSIIAASLLAVLVAPAMAVAQAASATDSQVVATAPTTQPALQAKPDAQPATVSDANEAAEEADDQAPTRDRRVHGEITVGAGTGGYREVGGAATVPIGETGEASIAIDAGQINRGSAPRPRPTRPPFRAGRSLGGCRRSRRRRDRARSRRDP